MKVNSQLERAQQENLASLPGAATAGRFAWNTTDGRSYLDDGTAWRAFLRNDQKAIFGNSGTAANNVRFHRGANGVLQLVSGADVTAEGTLSTALNQISAKQENYSTGTLPANGNQGRVAFVTDTLFLAVDNGSAWKTLVDTNSTQTITGKDLTGNTFTSALFAQTTTPANPSAGFNKAYFKADGFLYTLDSSGNEAKVGSGSGGVKNLVLNGNADDTAASIFVPYADAAGTRPVDGTGGSPTVTTSVSSTSPLDGIKSYLLTKPASNVQGQGWAVPFTVDPAYRAKSLKISADFIVNSGTFVAGSNGSTPTDGDLIWYIYDVTNSLLIEPSNIKMFSQDTTISDKFEATLQSSASGSSYRLIAHVASTSALAFEIKLDNITVSPQVNVFGTPVTDWSAYTPVLSSGVNVNNNQAAFRRVGKNLEITGRLSWNGNGTDPANFLVSLPPGLVLDGTLLLGSYPSLGTATFLDSGVDFNDLIVTSNGTNQFAFLQDNAADFLKGTSFTTSDEVTYTISVPIQGWSSSVKISDSYDGRLIAASAYSANTVAIPNVTYQKIDFTSMLYDYTGSFDLVNDRFVVPSAGLYKVSGFVNMSVGSGIRAVLIYKNGAPYITVNATVAVSGSGFSGCLPISHELDLVAGDYLEIFCYQDSGGASNIVGNFMVNFSKIQSPQAIAATELILTKYNRSSNQAIASSTETIVDFNTKEFDTHGAVTTGGSWNFKAPEAGYYKLSALVSFDLEARDAGSFTQLRVYVNAAASSILDLDQVDVATTTRVATQGSTTLQLKAGDLVDLRVFHNSSGSKNITNDASYSHIEIERIK